MYYRMLATPWLEITPDVQWLSRTAAQGQAEPLTISRVTIRLLF
jgi:carbohydrate-selective porin OprB